MDNKFFKNLPFFLILAFFILSGLGRAGLVIFFVLALFVTGVILFKKYKKNIPPSSRSRSDYIDINKLNIMNKSKSIVLTAVVLVFGLWLFFASIVIVDAGQTGVYSLFGKVSDNELKSGFHLVIPLAKVTKMSIRTEEYTMSIAQGEGRRFGADAITSLTKEGLSVDLDMTVFYRLEEERAAEVYRELSTDYQEKIIRPGIRTAIRDVIAQYSAKDIYSDKHEEVAEKILEKIQGLLQPRGITVEEVLLRNVQLPANLANSIQEKLQAEQEAQKYEFILDREQKEKERKLIEAEGQRDAQKIINESLSVNYLYYLYINELKDREGTIYVPTSPETGMPLFRNIGQ